MTLPRRNEAGRSISQSEGTSPSPRNDTTESGAQVANFGPHGRSTQTWPSARVRDRLSAGVFFLAEKRRREKSSQTHFAAEFRWHRLCWVPGPRGAYPRPFLSGAPIGRFPPQPSCRIRSCKSLPVDRLVLPTAKSKCALRKPRMGAKKDLEYRSLFVILMALHLVLVSRTLARKDHRLSGEVRSSTRTRRSSCRSSLASIRSSRRTMSSRRLFCEIDASQIDITSVTMIGSATDRNC